MQIHRSPHIRHNELHVQFSKALILYDKAVRTGGDILAARQEIIGIRDEMARHHYEVGMRAGIFLTTELMRKEQDG